QNEQSGDQQPQDQQNEQQPGDQPNDQSGQEQPDQQPQNGQAGGQPGEPSEEQPDGQGVQVVEGLSQEQAKQLFEAATRGTESLEEYLQQVLVAPGGQSAEDW
ncbi:MAG: hypothetical protein KDI62_19590, partial [Anaerolineae bacterium]|nr:hypothetical protein [Anaerolineae bacterium]